MDRNVVRDARSSDAHRFAAIYSPYVEGSCVSFESAAPSPEEMASRIEEKLGQGFPWLALEVGGELAGYAYYGPWRSREAYRGTVESTIYLDPAFQGRGLGKLLYGELVDRARSQGRHAMIGIVALPNEASAALHRKLGFARAGLYREVGFKLGRWVDIESWELRL
ncbi:MAG TPA: N-acetyltransferase family protein [Spirochaetales bacterium]|nr:N-acetyltransferase family protein [Spirochaetales bacterium]HRY55393.1 N-acetyltransferase family protein [Spirochaetia bacterium]